MNNQPIPSDHFEKLPAKKSRARARLTSEEQIIAKIDKFTQKAKYQREKAEELMRDAKTLRQLSAKEELDSPESLKFSGSACRKEDQAQEWTRRAARIHDRVLAPLKQRLSEFQTDVIPGFLPDYSVEAPR